MSEINIDVVSAGSRSDTALLSVRDSIEDEIVAVSVIDMVEKILRRLGNNGRLRRLRTFGHGAPGLTVIGDVPTTLTLSSSEQILTQHSLKTIRVIHHGIVNSAGQRQGDAYPILNEQVLRRLTPKFASGGWTELHACNVAEGNLGEHLLMELANLWRVPVKGGTGLQVAGGGFENSTVIARPGVSTVTTRHRPSPRNPSSPWWSNW